MGVEWVRYKGKKILYCDYSGLMKNEEILGTQEREVAMIAESKEPVLLLVNVVGSFMTAESAQFMKEALTKLNPKIKKIALVGVIGLKTIIVKGISTSIGEAEQEMFATLDDAKKWLVL